MMRKDPQWLFERALDEGWNSIPPTALVTALGPGNDGYLDLLAAFALPATSVFQIRVAVIPGAACGKEYGHFALELVRVVSNGNHPNSEIPKCDRARVFRYNKLVTHKMLSPISQPIPNHPFIELLKIDDDVVVEIRGVQYIEPRRWNEEITALVEGAWLITRDDNRLATAEITFELEISAAIEEMATRGQEGTHAPSFTKTSFSQHWPMKKMSRTNLYNIIPDTRWPDIIETYYRRWKELHQAK